MPAIKYSGPNKPLLKKTIIRSYTKAHETNIWFSWAFVWFSLDSALEIDCGNCHNHFQMEIMETQYPLGMVYGVTPCHSHSSKFLKAAGVN